MNIEKMDCAWWDNEFESIDFGDKRLKNRLVRIADQLSSQPLDPINKACSSWADTKASYRLFANDKVNAEEIIEAHSECTWERTKKFPFILAIQDTSYMDYSSHIATQGLGHIGTSRMEFAKGLVQHTTLAMSPEGVPLGLLDQQIWAREISIKTPELKRKKSSRPRQEKESARWLNCLELVKTSAPEGVEVITIADRECDIYDFIAYAEKIEALFLIRAATDRCIFTSENEDEWTHLWKYLRSQPKAGKVLINVPAKGTKEPARNAYVEIRFAQVELKRPQKPRSSQDAELQKTVLVYAILLEEVNPPKGVTTLEWMLLTNTAVTTLEEAIEKMNWYRLRWGIEVFHKVLKSGCRVEDCRLGTAERLKKYLALMSIVAWRIHWMTHLNRQSPDSRCDLILEEHEWKALYCKIHKTQNPPNTPPTIHQAVRWIAQLGGFLARKGDGEPGTLTIWRGWQRLTDIADDWTLFKTPR